MGGTDRWTTIAAGALAALTALGAAACGDEDGSIAAPEATPATDVGVPVLDGTWVAMEPAPLTEREDAVAVWTGTDVLVTGGRQASLVVSDGAAFDPITGSWSPIADPGSAHPDAHGVWTGTELVWLAKGSGMAYLPDTDTWHGLPPLDGPVLNGVGFPVWTGTELLGVSFAEEAATARLRIAALDSGTASWELRSDTAVPITEPAWSDASIAWHDGSVLVWAANRGWTYRVDGDSWAELPPLERDGWTIRHSVIAAVDDTAVTVVSAEAGGLPSMGAARLTADGWQWLDDVLTGVVTGPLHAVAGEDLVAVLSEEAVTAPVLVDPAGGRLKLADDYPGIADRGRSALWAGDRLVVWGGSPDGSPAGGNGWIWTPSGEGPSPEVVLPPPLAAGGVVVAAVPLGSWPDRPAEVTLTPSSCELVAPSRLVVTASVTTPEGGPAAFPLHVAVCDEGQTEIGDVDASTMVSVSGSGDASIPIEAARARTWNLVDGDRCEISVALASGSSGAEPARELPLRLSDEPVEIDAPDGSLQASGSSTPMSERGTLRALLLLHAWFGGALPFDEVWLPGDLGITVDGGDLVVQEPSAASPNCRWLAWSSPEGFGVHQRLGCGDFPTSPDQSAHQAIAHDADGLVISIVAADEDLATTIAADLRPVLNAVVAPFEPIPLEELIGSQLAMTGDAVDVTWRTDVELDGRELSVWTAELDSCGDCATHAAGAMEVTDTGAGPNVETVFRVEWSDCVGVGVGQGPDGPPVLFVVLTDPSHTVRVDDASVWGEPDVVDGVWLTEVVAGGEFLPDITVVDADGQEVSCDTP